MENLQTFQCKYCQCYFHSFDSLKSHIFRHENRQPHRTLHFKWKDRKAIKPPKTFHEKGRHQLSYKNVNSTQRQKDLVMYQEREQLNCKQKPANQVSQKQKSSSIQRCKVQRRLELRTCQKKGRQSKQRQTRSGKTSKLKRSQDSSEFHMKFLCIGQLFKSQCQQKYHEIKTMNNYNQFSCLKCGMYGFTNEREVLLHEKMSKHCAYCKKWFRYHANFVIHSCDREAYLSNTTEDLCVVQSNKDSPYYNLNGHEVFKCKFCKCTAWFTETGYIDHMKSEHSVCKCLICQKFVFISDIEKHLKSRKHLENVRALSTSQGNTNSALAKQSVGNSQENNYEATSTKGNVMGNQSHKPLPCICDVCNQECPSYCFYNWHIESHKSQMSPFRCFNCSQSFASKKYLIEHEVAKSHCSYCGKQFKTEIELMRHRTETIAEGNKYHRTEQIPVVMKDNNGVVVATGHIRQLSLETSHAAHKGVEGKQDYSSLAQKPAVATSHTASYTVVVKNQDYSSLPQKPAVVTSHTAHTIADYSSLPQKPAVVAFKGSKLTFASQQFQKKDTIAIKLPALRANTAGSYHTSKSKTPVVIKDNVGEMAPASSENIRQVTPLTAHAVPEGKCHTTTIEQNLTVIKDNMGAVAHETPKDVRKVTPTPVAITSNVIKEGNGVTPSDRLVNIGEIGQKTILVPLAAISKSNSTEKCVSSGSPTQVGAMGPLVTTTGQAGISNWTEKNSAIVTEMVQNTSKQATLVTDALLDKDKQVISTIFTEGKPDVSITKNKPSTIAINLPSKNGKDVQITATIPSGFKAKDVDMKYGTAMVRCQCLNCKQYFQCKRQLVNHEVIMKHCAYCSACFTCVADLLAHRVAKHKTNISR